ncbi:patatin-like phospholipase family protein [Cellulomonas aerilata]|uniref:patatin-like phospholipase family protein n=1 Tax=Cellulomonas aerilata TaxID=515326 RepID=UPI001649D5ED|nr:patatin-like phospholipase family protein [Cellulomonas aerilata]
MTVRRGRQALTSLRLRLGAPPPAAGRYVPGPPVEDVPADAVGTPDGFTVEPPPDWLWAGGGSAPALRDPAAYRAAGTAPYLSLAPVEVARRGLDDAQKEHYCRSSADVTMRGGTTSGVVYPLAVCEIARSFRLRNVGGASAGAIAAGMAAAAEVGRASGVDDVPLADADRERGHVRPGFAGLADAMAWLCQLDDPAGTPERHRLASLFRPARPGRHLFRVAEAYWAERWLTLPYLVVRATGLVPTLVVAAALVVAGMLLGQLSHAPGADIPWLRTASLGTLGLLGILAVLIGVGLGVAAWPPGEAVPSTLDDPVVPRTGRSAGAVVRALWLPVASVLTGVALVAACLVWSPIRLEVLVTVAAGLLLTVLLALAAGAAVILARAKRFGYGVVAGADSPRGARGADPSRTAGRPVVTWLSDTLGELSGLTHAHAGGAGPVAGGPPVLRFGHLWCGPDFDPAHPGEAVEMSARPELRRVNLELITSELVQSRAYRFPLPRSDVMREGDGSPLYVSVADLTDPDRQVVPADVRQVLLQCDDDPDLPRPTAEMTDIRTGDRVRLVPLPEPWNLPVVLAVRLSMSLPGLFQAVRLYREAEAVPVRDELGRALLRDGVPVVYPSGAGPWCEQLWFTDGGVTSNFPIHFFDSPLPLWPTFGIDLGSHPPGRLSQDVWVPQDWDVRGAPTRNLSAGMPAFLSAIIGTARGWRDTEQTFMPGTRGRVAWVRQRAGEGGANLFMDNATIASLALRGVVAGARLRRRFSDLAYWRRSQWIRMRAAVGSLEELAQDVTRSRHRQPYDELSRADLAAAALRRITGADLPGDPRGTATSPDLPWYEPAEATAAEYWRAVQTLLDGVEQGARPADDTLLTDDVPQPSPVLRQVPRV